MRIPLSMSLCLVLANGCFLLEARDVGPPSPLYEAPWPDERLRTPDGTVDVSSFIVGNTAPLVQQVIDALDGARGFGSASGIFFAVDGPVESERLEAASFLVNVDPSSPEYGRRMPIDVRYLDEGGLFGPDRLVVILPYPGITLAPETLYAAGLTLGVRAAPFGEPHHRDAVETLRDFGIDGVAHLAVFRTDDPTREMREAHARVLSEPRPEIAPPELFGTYDAYCVYRSIVDLPVYQRGDPPYLSDGGDWAYDENGALLLDRYEAARVFFTVPRGATPEGGHPTAVFVRTGGGGDLPLVDRGPRDAEGRSFPGAGPAVDLADAGVAGVSIDGPLGGIRNLGAWDEQFVLFNLLNLPALSGNLQQSALELTLLAHLLDDVVFDSSDCDGGPEARFAADRLALIAHSNGATVAPLAVAVEPRFDALIMSGAGASWIRQVMYKESPVPTRPIAELALGYGFGGGLVEHDPVLSMLQWAGESADPILYGRAVMGGARPPPAVLVFQGVRDTYIPPTIANPVALSLGLRLEGEALDEQDPRTRDHERTLRSVLPLLGERAPSERAATVAQYPDDGIEDGHEVLFQRADARERLRTFLRAWVAEEQ